MGSSKNRPLFALQIDDIELVERRGYLTIRFTLPREGGTLLLRKTDGIRKWHQALQVIECCVKEMKYELTKVPVMKYFKYLPSAIL